MPQFGFVCCCPRMRRRFCTPRWTMQKACWVFLRTPPGWYTTSIWFSLVTFSLITWSRGSQLLHRKLTVFSHAKIKQSVREQFKNMQLSRSFSKFLLDLASVKDSFLTQSLLWWMIILFCILKDLITFSKLVIYI